MPRRRARLLSAAARQCGVDARPRRRTRRRSRRDSRRRAARRQPSRRRPPRLAAIATPADGPPPELPPPRLVARRSSSTTPTSSSRRRTGCSSSTSTPCTSASCSSSSAAASAPARWKSQRLLIPEPVDLPAEQAARVLEAPDALAELGLERRGLRRRHGAAVAATRRCSAGVPPREIFQGVVDHLATKDRPPTRDAAAQRPAGDDGLQGRGAGRRPADARRRSPPCCSCGSWPTTRTTARTAGRRRCCSAGRTWTSSSSGCEAFHEPARSGTMHVRRIGHEAT